MGEYTIREAFLTLQGEGGRAGTRAVFLRFAGCNMWNGLVQHRDKGKGACAKWCDTDFATGTKMTKEKILDLLDSLWPCAPPRRQPLPPGMPSRDDRWVVLTGGEPLLQVNAELITFLRNNGWRLSLETNGTVEQPGAVIDYVCVSPKLLADGSLPKLEMSYANELKVVLPGHIEPTLGWTDEKLMLLAGKVTAEVRFIQPMDPLVSQNVLSATHLHTMRSQHAKQPDQRARLEYEANLARCISFVMSNPSWRLGTQAHKYWDLP